MGFSETALEVLKSRYLLKDKNGKLFETPVQLFRRVAKAVAGAEKNKSMHENEFFNLLSTLEFLPNSPTLMNAGTEMGQLSACFILPIEDSMESIFSAVKDMALIFQSGGGAGFNFSKLRPKGDIVKSTMGVASGPVSFMQIFDKAAEVIKQGGKRRGAAMGILNADHPDIIEFITSKNKNNLSNFNISVAVTDKFMQAVEKNKDFELINPRTKKTVKKISAKKVFNLIAESAWKTGDPGMLFIDEINRNNPLKEKIDTVNPCGEVPAFAYESCVLGSINLMKMLKGKEVDLEKLKKTVHTAVRFLDDIISVNKFPIKKIEEKTKSNRRIGLGIMGWADFLIKLSIPYDSDEALELAEKLMNFIQKEARSESEKLGKERGNFPNFRQSKLSKKYKYMRNLSVASIAPTGSISLIVGVSSGIEPLFALSFKRNILGGKEFYEINPQLENILKQKGLYSKKLMKEISQIGSIQSINVISEEVKKVFKTAFDINPEWHIRMQASFQKHVDNSISKTVNLPPNAKINDIKKIFMLAYKLKCKGTTVYRYGSKENQVLTFCPKGVCS